VIPIPPARNTAALAEFLCSVKEPMGGSIFTCVPRGTFFSERLNAVSRVRVANIKWFSKRGLAIEKVRVLPSESVSGGLESVRSADWPRLEIEWRRFLEIEGRGAFRNLKSIQQVALVSCHRNFVSSDESLLDFRSNADPLSSTGTYAY
jgi:hypothetical protein